MSLSPNQQQFRNNLDRSLLQGKDWAVDVLQFMGSAVIVTDGMGAVQYLNPVAESMTGWYLDQVQGVLLSEVFWVLRSLSDHTIPSLVTRVRSTGKAVDLPPASQLVSRNGKEYAIEGNATPMRDRNRDLVGIVITFRDVTQHYALAHKLSWQASHDFLTGLVNRREFEQRLSEAISNAKQADQSHTLCYLDLDQFKIVNDACGHVAGDELLRQLSVRLRKQLRGTDTLARIGGDEFGVIFHDCELADATQVVEHLLSMIQGFRFVWKHNTFSVGASIGLVAINSDSKDLNGILGAADAACYAAKEKGRNRIHIYQPDDQELVQQRGERRWVTQIVQALEEKRFQLYKQVIVPIKSSATTKKHYELLLRMVSESGEIISPIVFIPAAERYGLMPALDRWVIEHFFARYQAYVQECCCDPTEVDCVFTINLSGVSLNDDQFLGFIQDQFKLHPVSPQSICFEITETAAISNLAKAEVLIAEIKKLGCSFALDDFGSGMSSFTYLKHLSVDYIKIDGSFIKNIVTDAIDSTVVECINRIGHEMGMQTIAEFVEDDLILAKLRAIGIDYVQGYEIAEPSPLEYRSFSAPSTNSTLA